jgi:D-xylose transport system permease protein
MEFRMTATTAPETTGRASEDSKTPLASRITDALGGPFRSIPVLLTLVVIWALFYSQNSAYLSFANITNLTLQIVTTAILALGIVFVLLVGEIDLSVAALSGVCATVAANLSVNMGWPLAAGVAAGVVVGLVVVFIEAQIVIFGVPSLIVTLGGMVILQGLLLVVLPPEFTVSVGGTTYAKIASSRVPTGVSLAIAFVGWAIYCYSRVRNQRDRRGSVAAPAMTTSVILPAVVSGVVIFGIVAVLSHGNGLPLPVLILTAMLLAASYATTRTRYGTHLYAVGGNREAAQRAGIPVARMITYSFLVLGLCGAIAGIVDASRLLGVSVSSGSGPLMLNAIAAAVVGGTSLFGGRGTVWAALIGALVIGSINNGVQLLGLSTEVQNFATGAVLILAVSIDVVITRGSIRPNRH